MPSAEFDSARNARLVSQEGLDPIEFILFGEVWRCVPFPPPVALTRLDHLTVADQAAASAVLLFLADVIVPDRQPQWAGALAANPVDVGTLIDVATWVLGEYQTRIHTHTTTPPQNAVEDLGGLDAVTRRQAELEGYLDPPDTGDPRLAHIAAAGGEIG